MSEEISIQTKLAVSNGNLAFSQSVSSQPNQTTAGGVQRAQTIPTADTVITLTGVTTPRAILIENTDADNYIDIGPTASGAIAPCMRLLPGESAVFSMYPGVVLRGLAHTASVTIVFLIVEA